MKFQSGSKLRVGYGEKTITPHLGIELTGYGFYLNRRAESVLDDLKVRTLFLKQGSVDIVLISCDLLGFTVTFSDIIREEIASQYGIPSTNILLTCTHTHSGPATQPLPGMGKVDLNELDRIKRAIEEAVREAEAGCREADVSFISEAIEPIGYNRTRGDFEGIDPILRGVIFRQQKEKIYLLNYACHPVTLGRSREISADWPGAVIREIEKEGHRGIFFQGFCGDIDPVTHMNRWGSGSREDLLSYGKRIVQSALKAERKAIVHEKTTLKAVEKRIRLPLAVCQKDEIEGEARMTLENNMDFPSAERFIDEWKMRAYNQHSEFEQNPFMKNVPLQVMAIGQLKILGVPAEVFCGMGIHLQKKYHPLLTVGFANGNIGYLPDRNGFQDPLKYETTWASKIYSVFPFSEETEQILMEEMRALLDGVSL